MAISHGYRSFWTSLALVALVGNVIASAFCCAPSSSRRAEIIDPILGAIPLCTNVLGSADGSGKLPKGSRQHCPVCLAAACKAIGSGTSALLFAAQSYAVATPARDDATPPAQHLKLGGLGSRAPPLHV